MTRVKIEPYEGERHRVAVVAIGRTACGRPPEDGSRFSTKPDRFWRAFGQDSHGANAEWAGRESSERQENQRRAVLEGRLGRDSVNSGDPFAGMCVPHQGYLQPTTRGAMMATFQIMVPQTIEIKEFKPHGWYVRNQMTGLFLRKDRTWHRGTGTGRDPDNAGYWPTEEAARIAAGVEQPAASAPETFVPQLRPGWIWANTEMGSWQYAIHEPKWNGVQYEGYSNGIPLALPIPTDARSSLRQIGGGT